MSLGSVTTDNAADTYSLFSQFRLLVIVLRYKIFLIVFLLGVLVIPSHYPSHYDKCNVILFSSSQSPIV